MTITISEFDPRSIKAIHIAAGAGSWLNCRTTDGRKAYGIPSQRQAGLFHLASCEACTCQDAQRHPGQPCKHVLAVRLHVTLSRAQLRRGVKATTYAF